LKIEKSGDFGILNNRTDSLRLIMRQSPKARKWESERSPRRILVIRLQATGDVIITFPFVQLLKNQHPETKIDFLTRKSQVAMVENLAAVETVIPFTDSHRRWPQIISMILILPKLLFGRYDVVLDLQVTKFSAITRRLLFPTAFTEFEKFTPFTAADRNWKAIQASGLLTRFEHPKISFKDKNRGLSILQENGWDGQKDLIVLNPGGAFKSRNWPTESYAVFAKIWLKKYPESQFLLLGVQKIAEKADLLKKELGADLINLVAKTTLPEAFGIISKTRLVLSEDSGLMHMAWALKIPTIALIGSTDKNRSSQNGTHIVTLNSDDLPCGNCMKPHCQFGEIPVCLSRYSPEMIVTIGEKLVLNNG
jgi:heptosyltransferase-2